MNNVKESKKRLNDKLKGERLTIGLNDKLKSLLNICLMERQRL
jgi:hypothetical protein